MSYIEKLQKEDQAAYLRYLSKLNVLGINECPYNMPGDIWSNDPTKWPDVQWPDVYHYLTETPDHKEAVDASKQWKAVETAVMKAASKSEEAVTAALRNTYFAAKQHLPSSIVPDLNNLCIRQGVTQLNDLRVDSHTTYEHNTSIEDFQDSIMTVINEDIMKEVKQSRKFSLMIDESTDISVKQNLVTYIRVLTTNNFGVVKPATYFLGINELYRTDAESIYTKL